MKRRIENTTSRTAEITCMSRAISSLERNSCYKSEDYIAVLLLPTFFRLLIYIPFFRTLFSRKIAPKGIYAYVVARTKYIDSVFIHSLDQGFGQIVIFGAGFDTRALRFRHATGNAKIFELDAPVTQSAKINQYHRRGLDIPPNLIFVPVNFEKESFSSKLEEAGFDRHTRSFFILEGVLMYLQPESATETLGTIHVLAKPGSEIVFDYIHSSILLKESLCDEEKEIVETVSRAGEQWHFGIGKGEIENFLSNSGFELVEHLDSHRLEQLYFKDSNGLIIDRVNSTHSLVRARKA